MQSADSFSSFLSFFSEPSPMSFGLGQQGYQEYLWLFFIFYSRLANYSVNTLF